MARPRKRTDLLSSVSLRFEPADWADLALIYGSAGRGDVIRQLVAAHLQRPGAETPAPLTRVQLGNVRRAARSRASSAPAASSASSSPGT